MTETPPRTEPVGNDGNELSCGLDAEELAAFIDGRVSAEAAERIEAHLARCEACRWVAAESVRNVPIPRNDR